MRFTEPWEGVVVGEIEDGFFPGRFIATAGDTDEELEANFFVALVAKEQRDMIVEGAPFLIHVEEQPPRIEFITLPPITQEQVDAAKKWANEKYELFKGYVE